MFLPVSPLGSCMLIWSYLGSWVALKKVRLFLVLSFLHPRGSHLFSNDSPQNQGSGNDSEEHWLFPSWPHFPWKWLRSLLSPPLFVTAPQSCLLDLSEYRSGWAGRHLGTLYMAHTRSSKDTKATKQWHSPGPHLEGCVYSSRVYFHIRQEKENKARSSRGHIPGFFFLSSKL